MKILICHYGPQAKQVTEGLRKEGHDVLITNWQVTEEPVRNFVRVNYLDFGEIKMLMKLYDPDEIHNFVAKSYLANSNIIWAGTRAKRIVFYYDEQSELLDTIATAISKEYGFRYEKK